MQKKSISEIRDSSRQESKTEIAFSSNCVRLSGYEWIVVGVVALALFFFGPMLWERMEKFEPGPDYRLDYQLGSDYRLYNRYCRWAASKYETLVIGDSVIWGHLVSNDNTLSHYLNEATGREQFANLGVDGIHPAALAGLLQYYGRAISGKNVILHLNPLWMSSEKHDLQSKKEFHFNHPRLVPQFFPNIPCYKDSYSRRISAVAERYVPLLSWTSHLKIAYFGNMDLPAWTLEHPYENPAGAVTRLDTSFENQVPWSERGITKTDFQWVQLETSLQWKFFQQSVKLLTERGNSVFVLVGPFNEHMMTDESVEIYKKIKSKIELWLQQNNIDHYMPPVLPSELYVDASHPLSEGYAILAKQLLENK
ncbi:MAG: hypothetical protein ACYTFW_09845 [Planctomycetota bacterium]|jgi:hypothetical protein